MSVIRGRKMEEGKSGRVCPADHVKLFDNFLRPILHSPRRLFGPHVCNGMKALDLGCGRGFASLGLAKLVGDDGIVVAADLQPEMLEMVAERAKKAGLSQRIRLHRCQSGTTGLEEEFDFVLAFWMAHETPDPPGFLKEVHTLLKPGGRFFLAEPKMHVSAKCFSDYIDEARSIGFKPVKKPFVLFSRSVVLERES